jgi:thioester reductase-like protein
MRSPLLTGATGLLGAYLLRDLTHAGVRPVVLVRSTRRESARQRVEALMVRWDREAGFPLARPVVLEGDLGREGLGLSDRDRKWIAENCDGVLHNAASLTFKAEEGRDGEPYRSNVEGTRRLLDLCRDAGLRRFHHVSTAYVCGLRTGLIRESELDEGQKFGNDYEVSKSEAERLVRGADFLDAPTVYRPAIILGDSRNGYTTTFHGFYVPLKLVATLLSKTPAHMLSPEELREGIRWAGEQLRAAMRLTGTERKNFVPVDWVSAVMTHVVTHPEHHGKTYHLTPGERTPVELVQESMEQAFLDSVRRTPPPQAEELPWESDRLWQQFESFFLEGMDVYRSYWKDDPTFDVSNTTAAAPHLPCPDLDAATIRRMCRYAIDANFGWPKPPSPKPELDVQEHLECVFGKRVRTDVSPARVGLRVTGGGGGEWDLETDSGRVVGFETGVRRGTSAVFRLNSGTFRRLAERQMSADEAIATGRVLVEGDDASAAGLSQLLQDAAARIAPPAIAASGPGRGSRDHRPGTRGPSPTNGAGAAYSGVGEPR